MQQQATALAPQPSEDVKFQEKLLQESRASYEEAQKSLKKVAERIMRNRTVLETTRQKVKDLDQQWREMLRQADGQITAKVRDKQREHTETKELIPELEAMDREVGELFELRQVEAFEKRQRYLNMLGEFRMRVIEDRFTTATERLRENPDFQTLMSALSFKCFLTQERVRNQHEALNGGKGLHLKDLQMEMETQARHEKGAMLISFLEDVGMSRYAWMGEEFKAIPHIPEESQNPELKSHIYRQRIKNRHIGQQ